jgi:cobalamin synthase
MSHDLYWILTTALSAGGLAGSVGYLWRQSASGRDPARSSSLGGKRPWRRWGAVICAVVSVLFYVGLHHLDPAERPGTYLLVWIVILLLVLCLCVLALVDMLCTRRLTREALHRPGEPS